MSNEGVSCSVSETLYHMCQKSVWEEALSKRTAYFPPTFEKDGYFTHATSVPARLLQTANHFYTDSKDDWICVALNQNTLKNLGISTRFEQPKSVGDTQSAGEFTDWSCPHIFGGIPAFVDGVVLEIYPMKRDDKGTFLAIPNLVEEK